MPAEVQRVRAADIETGTGQTEGMIRQGAIVDRSDKICASGMLCYRIAVCLDLSNLQS